MTSQFSVNGAILNVSAPVVNGALNRVSATSTTQHEDGHPWRDAVWLQRREHDRPANSPVSIYRIYPAAWRVNAQGQPLSWGALARQLVPYAADLGFTHIELLGFRPPDEASTGTPARSETATPDGTCTVTDQTFAEFVDQCHEGGLGVILDWPPISPMTTIGEPVDEATVHEALPGISHYLDAFHLDGLRLELDVSTVPAAHLDRARDVTRQLQRLVEALADQFPNVMFLLEKGMFELGLKYPDHGRILTWNTAWCENVLSYLQEEPDARSCQHQNLMESLGRAFEHDYVLPLADGRSSKGLSTWLERMSGDTWQQFANLRACLGFMCAHPGKKLLGMGTEFAQGRGWRYDAQLDWNLFGDPCNAGVFRLVADLNRLYVTEPALHLRDWSPEGFAWVIGDDTENSVVAFLRYGAEGMAPLLAIVNFKPVVHHAYRVGVPAAGVWREMINTDSKFYGGSNVGNASGVQAEPVASHGYPASLCLTIPPLATLLLRQGDWPA